MEKYEIARQYLIPQELKKHALKPSELSISKTALLDVIEKHTREAGVRNLRRRIADIVRRTAKKILEEPTSPKVSVTIKNLKDFLEKTVFEIEKTDHINRVGMVNGLAWTAVGGDVLKIEAIRINGKGALQLTGSLGEVMKESARIAFSVVKTLVDSGKLTVDHAIIPLSITERENNTVVEASEVYKRFDLHVHVPDGATPKDGPSAGIAMSTVIASILTNKKVRADIAMTGEVSLTGNVLPIGGLKEKLIAAHRAGMVLALIPAKNYARDLNDIPDEVKNALEIRGVSRIEEVLEALLIEP
jgi:ATP-dependent Lon protease